MRRPAFIIFGDDVAALQLSIQVALAGIADSISTAPAVVTVDAYTAPVANDTFTVTHNLGVVPKNVIALPTADCRVWSTDADRSMWDERTVTLRGSATNTRVWVTALY